MVYDKEQIFPDSFPDTFVKLELSCLGKQFLAQTTSETTLSAPVKSIPGAIAALS